MVDPSREFIGAGMSRSASEAFKWTHDEPRAWMERLPQALHAIFRAVARDNTKIPGGMGTGIIEREGGGHRLRRAVANPVIRRHAKREARPKMHDVLSRKPGRFRTRGSLSKLLLSGKFGRFGPNRTPPCPDFSDILRSTTWAGAFGGTSRLLCIRRSLVRRTHLGSQRGSALRHLLQRLRISAIRTSCTIIG
jgi:hypothetical protein